MEKGHWILGRKPITEKTIADNVLKWGVGGLNIDKSRIDNSDMKIPEKANEVQFDKPKHTSGAMTGKINKMNVYNNEGRFPSNFIYTGCDEVFEEFDKAGYSKSNTKKGIVDKPAGIFQDVNGKSLTGHKQKVYPTEINDEGTPARYFQDVNNVEIKNNLENMKVKLMLGDSADKLKLIPDNYVDSIVSDPPAAIGFMSKEWDSDRGGRTQWVAWMSDIMLEAKRCLKPGGHCLIWALPRTSHWTATAMEDAGFEIRDVITHVFGSGFPKSHNISKAIDKKMGVEGEVIGIKENFLSMESKPGDKSFYDSAWGENKRIDLPILAPGSDEAKQWEGWGTGLKPASEHWILCRKPISEKSIAENVLKWGVGGLNIDKSRIATDDKLQKLLNDTNVKDLMGNLRGKDATGRHIEFIDAEQGRFPANFIHDGSDEVMEEFDKAGTLKSTKRNKVYQENYSGSGSTCFLVGSANPNNTYGDEGSAARFFYCSKPSGKEKNEGLDDLEDKERPGQSDKGLYSSSPYCRDCGKTVNGTNDHSKCSKNGLDYRPSIGATYAGQQTTSKIGGNPDKPTKQTKNNHPTIKPVKLMSYLINMITPPNGIVLDPFMGSGSTGVAAVKNNFNFIGIEKEEEYMKIAKARIEYTKLNTN